MESIRGHFFLWLMLQQVAAFRAFAWFHCDAKSLPTFEKLKVKPDARHVCSNGGGSMVERIFGDALEVCTQLLIWFHYGYTTSSFVFGKNARLEIENGSWKRRMCFWETLIFGLQSLVFRCAKVFHSRAIFLIFRLFPTCSYKALSYSNLYKSMWPPPNLMMIFSPTTASFRLLKKTLILKLNGGLGTGMGSLAAKTMVSLSAFHGEVL